MLVYLALLFICQATHTTSSDIAKKANSVNNGERKIEFGLLGGEESEYNGVYFVEISEILAMQDAFLSGMTPFDRV